MISIVFSEKYAGTSSLSAVRVEVCIFGRDSTIPGGTIASKCGNEGKSTTYVGEQVADVDGQHTRESKRCNLNMRGDDTRKAYK
ncbi:hypothetical protein V6N12_042456 [Hibiscus sabdariffa]|uniref:Uncharacterized protein n=1 Tax=Hibiscus sabdariffa TaxID=183260 RepID=A0ABR2EEU3_9ROSI